MRSLLLAAGLLLSSICQAQVFTPPPVYHPAYPPYIYYGPYGTAAPAFELGSYVLKAEPAVRQHGQLRPSGTALVTVKYSDKQEREYTTEEVSSFCIGKKRFVVEKNIKRTSTYHTKKIDQAFVAVLDSGQQIVLMELAYCSDGPCYAIRRPQDAEATLVEDDNLLPYLADRPDLVKLYKANYFSKHYVGTDRLYIIAHALNTGQPYVPPLSHYEIMKQQALAKRAKKAAAAAADSTKK